MRLKDPTEYMYENKNTSLYVHYITHIYDSNNWFLFFSSIGRRGAAWGHIYPQHLRQTSLSIQGTLFIVIIIFIHKHKYNILRCFCTVCTCTKASSSQRYMKSNTLLYFSTFLMSKVIFITEIQNK